MLQIDRHSYRSPNYEPRPAGVAISAIVLHHGGGSRTGDLGELCNPRVKKSAHYYVCRDGTTYGLVDDGHRAWHAGVSSLDGVDDVNDFSVGIETEHRPGQDWPAAQLAAIAALCRDLMARYQIPPARVVSHRAIAPGRKFDPSDAPLGPEPAFRAWVDATLGRPAPTSYTADSPILAAPGATLPQLTARVPRGAYTARDIPTIVGGYWRACAGAGVDPVVALAQMCHETGGLTSWWCKRPRRNPAGLGVTGDTRPITMNRPGPDWQADEPAGVWRQGLAFDGWDPQGIQAHVGRLLAYALTDAQASTVQRVLIDRALALRPLPAAYRGVAPTLAGLGGTWAVPGETYATKLAAWANRLAERAA